MSHSSLVEIIDSVYERAEHVITSMYPDEEGGEDAAAGRGVDRPSATLRNPDRSGVVAAIDVRAIGSYVPVGGPLLHVADRRPNFDETRIQRAIVITDERTIDQNPLYGFRLLVDIATRALSLAVNDPTTAVQAVDRIAALLGLLAGHHLHCGEIRDESGRVRLVVPLPEWDDFVSVSLTEIRQYGSASSQVVRRLRAVLDDLLLSVPACRRPALEHQLALLDQTTASVYRLPVERELVRTADRLGLGEPASLRRRNSVSDSAQKLIGRSQGPPASEAR